MFIFKPKIDMFFAHKPTFDKMWEKEFAMSRLTIDMTEQQHQALKAMAALSGKSIKQYSLERLLPSDEEQAIAELRNMLEARLVAAEKTPSQYLSAKAVVEQVIREDEGLQR